MGQLQAPSDGLLQLPIPTIQQENSQHSKIVR